MSLQTRLMDDLKEAMRRRDELPRSVIRLMRAAIQEEQIDKRVELDDAGVIEVLSRMARRYRESIEQFGQANRQDLVAREEAEQAVLMKYLPQQLSREEVLDLARKVVGEMGARSPADRGKVMGKLMPQLRGRADGNMVNGVVTELLESMAGL